MAYYLNSSSGAVALINDQAWIDPIKNNEDHLLLSSFRICLDGLISVWNPEKLDDLAKSYLLSSMSESRELDEHLYQLIHIIAKAPQQAQSNYQQLKNYENNRKYQAKIIELLINDKSLIDHVMNNEGVNAESFLQAAGQFAKYFENPLALANSYLRQVYQRQQYIYEEIQRNADYYLQPIANASQENFNKDQFNKYLLSQEGILSLANDKNLIDIVHRFERWGIITLESNFISILSNWNIDGKVFLKNTYLNQRLQVNEEIDRVIQEIHFLLPSFALSEQNLNDSYTGNKQLLEEVLNNQTLLDKVVNQDAKNLAALQKHSEKLAALWDLNPDEYFTSSYLQTLLIKATEYMEVFAEVSNILRLAPEAGGKYVEELDRIPHTLPSLLHWIKKVFEDQRLLDSLASISTSHLEKLEYYLVPLEEFKKELKFTYFYRRQNVSLFMNFWEAFQPLFLQKDINALINYISFPLKVHKYWFDQQGNEVDKRTETVFAGELSATLDAIYQSSFKVGSNNFGYIYSTNYQLIKESKHLTEENKRELTSYSCSLYKAGLFFTIINGKYMLTEATVIYRQ